MITRLSRLATRRPRRLLAAMLALSAISVVLGLPAAGLLTAGGASDFQDPASQYERVNATIEAAIRQTPADNVTVLLSSEADIASDPGSVAAVATLARALAAQPGFQRVSDYASTRSPALLSRDRRKTVLLAAFATEGQATAAIARVRTKLATPAMRARLARMRVRFGGYALTTEELNDRTITDLERAELIGLPIVFLLCLWFFRGLVAAFLPPLVGGLAILLSFLALRAVNELTSISLFSLNLVSGMGLGLGIDYSLFVLYRYREELAGGASTQSAIEHTLRTAGRTVLFSSLTVAAAAACLLVFPMRFLYSMGIGGALVALCDGFVALLLLPALLLVLGGRIDALAPAWLRRRGARSATALERGGWWRLASGVTRHPLIVAVVSTALLLAVATPVLRLKFTAPAANLLPASAQSNAVEAALVHDFAVNVGEANVIVLKGSRATATRPAATRLAATRLAVAARRVAGRLASVSRPRLLGKRTWEIVLAPRGSPYTDAQQRLLRRLRALAVPYGAHVGGATAFLSDQQSAIASHIALALALLFVLIGAFLFLMTGSATIPAKAILMNLLSVSAGAGLVVLIFQDGHLSGLLSFTPIGGLEESTLVLMFVIAVALATDYEVFVIARIKEAHDEGLSNPHAIARGIERTGRIVTAAALLFCVAIGVLSTSELFFTKQLGLGTALSVAIDATIVRALLVPALMALMGDWNWWAPRPLRRLHSKLGLEEGGAGGGRRMTTRA